MTALKRYKRVTIEQLDMSRRQVNIKKKTDYFKFKNSSELNIKAHDKSQQMEQENNGSSGR